MKSHLKPNGFLVFNNHRNSTALSHRIVRWIKRIDLSDQFMSHEEAVSLIRSAGLVVRKVCHLAFLPDYDRFPIRPRWFAFWMETMASHLPLMRLSQDVIYVCSHRKQQA